MPERVRRKVKSGAQEFQSPKQAMGGGKGNVIV